VKDFLRYLLVPFAWVYGLIIRLRNWLFDHELRTVKKFDIPVIGIGNLSSGGTGKTPMAEYVLQLLLDNGYKPAMLSRGYKRKSTGYQVVKPYSTAAHVGDEPFQVKMKLPAVFVAVCEDRATGIQNIREQNPEINAIVLDDSFQHRKIKPGFNILLTDYYRPFYKDKMLPTGNLREPAEGKNRADIIVVTKCPIILDDTEKEKICININPQPHQQVMFSKIAYLSLIKAHPEPDNTSGYPVEYIKGYKVVLFTGIARNDLLKAYLESSGIDFFLFSFPDHHIFSKNDILKIKKKWESISQMNKLILTTEKDWRRMQNTDCEQIMKGLPLYFLPVMVSWDNTEKINFDLKILNYVGAHQSSN
jgi:tetraacyldisaccharide 4'-kinase